MERPRPVPAPTSLVVKNGSKMTAISRSCVSTSAAASLAATPSVITGSCFSPRSRRSIKRSTYSSGFMAALLCPCALAHVPAPGARLTPATHEIVTHARLPAVCPAPWQGPRSSALPENDQSRSPAVQHSDSPAPARLLRAFRAIRAKPLDYSPGRLPSAPPWHTALSLEYL